MKEFGMIFNAEMVEAILSGRKTQTRRMIKQRYGQCPYSTGDHIWVRETFHDCVEDALTGDKFTVYRATDGYDCKWTPAIHMPYSRSRITLEIISVRRERLQDITEADAMAEGIGEFGEWSGDQDVSTPAVGFEELWNSIYKNWDSNPWVWVIEFKMLEVKR